MLPFCVRKAVKTTGITRISNTVIIQPKRQDYSLDSDHILTLPFNWQTPNRYNFDLTDESQVPCRIEPEKKFVVHSLHKPKLASQCIAVIAS